MKPALGNHYLFDFFGCEPEILDNLQQLKEIFIEAARIGNATIVTDVFHRFSPQGVSGVVVIAESHLALHTWPEHGCASVDLFSCSSKINIDSIEEYLKKSLKAVGPIVRKKVPRGKLSALRSHPGHPTLDAHS